MSSKKLIEVAGFQFEPERIKETQGEIYQDNGDEKSESDTIGQDPRIYSDPWTWCKCGKCCKMLTEKECFYCKEVESVRYFGLHGNKRLAMKNIFLEKSSVVDASTSLKHLFNVLIKSQTF